MCLCVCVSVCLYSAVASASVEEDLLDAAEEIQDILQSHFAGVPPAATTTRVIASVLMRFVMGGSE